MFCIIFSIFHSMIVGSSLPLHRCFINFLLLKSRFEASDMLYTYQKHVDNAVAKYPSSSVVLIVSILLRFNEMFVLDDYFLAD